MARRALVTGAGGFVGANLCRRLLHDGLDVHAATRPGTDLWRLQDVSGELEVHRVELRNRTHLAAALDAARPDWVFHLAAHGAYSWQVDVDAIIATNTLAAAHLVDLVVEREVEALVQAGSSSEYGFKDHPPHEREWIEPNSAYAVSKAAATHYARAAALREGRHLVTLRLYSAYGPWEEPNRLFPALAVHGLRGSLPPLVDPRTARDYVYVDDVCDAFVRAAGADLAPGTVLNVGSGAQTSLEELVALARAELGVAEEPRWATMPPRAWDTSVWIADATLIESKLGWHARMSPRDGFRSLVQWFRDDPVRVGRYARAIRSLSR